MPNASSVERMQRAAPACKFVLVACEVLVLPRRWSCFLSSERAWIQGLMRLVSCFSDWMVGFEVRPKATMFLVDRKFVGGKARLQTTWLLSL